MQTPPATRTVVVGVDGSRNSLAALKRASREAAERRARLDVVRVLSPDPAAPRLLRTAAEWLRLRDLVPASTRDLTTRLRIVYGTPGEALAKAAQHAEALVIGAPANGDLLGGGTGPAIRRLTCCPVVICADHCAAPPAEAH